MSYTKDHPLNADKVYCAQPCPLCWQAVKLDEIVRDAEWGWVHVMCQERIGSPND